MIVNKQIKLLPLPQYYHGLSPPSRGKGTHYRGNYRGYRGIPTVVVTVSLSSALICCSLVKEGKAMARKDRV